MKSLLKFSLLTLFVFIYSCNTESVISDDELIELIINSKDKVSIAESELPSISLNYLDKEFEDFLEYSQLYKFKQHIEDHTKLKSTDKSLVPSKLREEMKYLDPMIDHLRNLKK